MRMIEGRKINAVVRRLVTRRETSAARMEPVVRRIIKSVRTDGDRALRRYAQRWDGLIAGQSLKVPSDEIQAAWTETSHETRKALRLAATNIRRFCEWQKPTEWTRAIAPGISVGQIVRPLESAGCYVPGGRFPLPSTLLMSVIPAQVAGVRKVRVVSPRPARETLAAAALLGVEEFYRIGGAQAIAALAYGTESIPQVDKIVGPGNLYVASAKRLVATDCAIDFLAGPTEVVIVADGGEASYIATDLVAQAEHDPAAHAIFITTSRTLARAVMTEVKKMQRRNNLARESLRRNGLILIADSKETALDLANQIAPEHLTISREDLLEIRNAGSVFVGQFSPQAAGDYASGPNHILPTGGAARVRGGLTVSDFLKVISVQELSAAGIQRIGPAVVSLAQAEGLRAHAESVRVRYAHA